MTIPRRVDNKSSMRGKVLAYLQRHPQELNYIVGGFYC